MIIKIIKIIDYQNYYNYRNGLMKKMIYEIDMESMYNDVKLFVMNKMQNITIDFHHNSENLYFLIKELIKINEIIDKKFGWTYDAWITNKSCANVDDYKLIILLKINIFAKNISVNLKKLNKVDLVKINLERKKNLIKIETEFNLKKENLIKIHNYCVTEMLKKSKLIECLRPTMFYSGLFRHNGVKSMVNLILPHNIYQIFIDDFFPNDYDYLIIIKNVSFGKFDYDYNKKKITNYNFYDKKYFVDKYFSFEMSDYDETFDCESEKFYNNLSNYHLKKIYGCFDKKTFKFLKKYLSHDYVIDEIQIKIKNKNSIILAEDSYYMYQLENFFALLISHTNYKILTIEYIGSNVNYSDIVNHCYNYGITFEYL
jgi:hypothetical protein